LAWHLGAPPKDHLLGKLPINCKKYLSAAFGNLFMVKEKVPKINLSCRKNIQK
jgi:hypothetical protein